MIYKINRKNSLSTKSKTVANLQVCRWYIITLILIGTVFKVSAQTVRSIVFTKPAETAKVAQGNTQSLLEYISTSDNAPVSVQLVSVDASGKMPTWLSVDNQNLSGINYTAGSEISFDFDATNLSLGSHSATVTASAAGYTDAILKIVLNVTSGQSGPLADLKVNFQDSATETPAGWLRDFGQPFGPRSSASQGNGYTYGWVNKSDKNPVDLREYTRRTNTPSDILLATSISMQPTYLHNQQGKALEGSWEVDVANGNYEVTVSVGDAQQMNSVHSINVEGINLINGFVPGSATSFKSATAIVSVSDGFLTVDGEGGTNTKINWIIITPYTGINPSVQSVYPDNGSKNVNVNTSISTSVLKLPNSGINNATITSTNVYLEEENTGNKVPAYTNGTGGGDAITLVPSSPLKTGTTYRFTITSGVKDLSDSTFVPFSSTFTTDTKPSVNLTNIQFDKITLPNTTGQHSSLTIGPDGKLYALTIDGIIKRFTINADGTLGTPELIYTLQDEYSPRTPVLAVGFTFDPASTSSNLIAWVTHDTYAFLNAPDWDGKLTRLSGPKLEKVEDVIVNLPRSKKDHVTNSIAFGPDGALYFTQASISAMGRADRTWGFRNEHLLSATVLRLDVSKLGPLPLDVKTTEGGGIYNPYDPHAPLTIYASGIRNGYDLVWHSNHNLYVPANSSAAGGNTPASVNGTLRPDGTVYNGPIVPALTDIQQTPTDFLYRVVKGGYYGHPNLLRGQFVMNGGNTSSAIDPAQLKDYPLGTAPDPNYRGYSYDFGVHASPNGAIEYKSNTFKGALKGKLMIVRYSQHKDIITLTPGGPNKDIISAIEGYEIQGFSGFNDPLDLIEDTTKGNIYVSEYGGNGGIVLLRPRIIVDTISKTTTGNNAKDSTVKNNTGGTIKQGNHGHNPPPHVKTDPTGGSEVTTNPGKHDHAPGHNPQPNHDPAQSTSHDPNGSTGTGHGSEPNSNESSVPNSPDPPISHVHSVSLATSVDHNVRTALPVRLAHTVPQCDDTLEMPTPYLPVALSRSINEEIKVYPNPVHKKFHVFIKNSKEESIVMQLIDGAGKKLDFGRFPLRPLQTDIEVDLTHLSVGSGIYFLRVISDSETQLVKVIVQE